MTATTVSNIDIQAMEVFIFVEARSLELFLQALVHCPGIWRRKKR